VVVNVAKVAVTVVAVKNQGHDQISMAKHNKLAKRISIKSKKKCLQGLKHKFDLGQEQE
jgi:hypothetical protein